jgi:hypothetical protein
MKTRIEFHSLPIPNLITTASISSTSGNVMSVSSVVHAA